MIRLCILLIRLVGAIVPSRIRPEWRQEWESELRHRELIYCKWSRKGGASILYRSIGSIWDALLLQPKRLEDEMFQDIRFGLRLLLKNPTFAISAILCLAIGIGINTVIFIIVKSILLAPLPFPEPDRLLQARLHIQQHNDVDDWLSHRDVLDWKERNKSFEKIGLYRFWILNFTGDDGFADSAYGSSASHEIFTMTGAKPLLGRYFSPEEDRPGNNQGIVLSHDLWKRRYGARTDIIGKTIQTSDGTFKVIGVMPSGFNFPLQIPSDLNISTRRMGYWLSIGRDDARENRARTNRQVILQLKKGVTIEQAQADINRIASQLEKEYPQTNKGRKIILAPLKKHVLGNADKPLLVIWCAGGLIILLLTANIANLTLSRFDVRRKEIAVRFAIGASRLRLVRQMLTESILIAVIGGILGIIIVYFIIGLITHLVPFNIPRKDELRIDSSILAYTSIITILIGLLFGLLPSWRAVKINLNDSLKRFRISRFKQLRNLGSLRELLIINEIAIALVLTLGAGLLINSYARMISTDPGFKMDGLVSSIIAPKGPQFPDANSNAEFFRKVIDRIKQIPGIDGAASSNCLLLTKDGNGDHLKIEGQISDPNEVVPITTGNLVSKDYFRTMGIKLLEGRTFTPHDKGDTQPVAIINESAARLFLKGESPIGKRISIMEPEGKEIWRKVVGIVNGTRYERINLPPPPEVYVPIEQKITPVVYLYVRSSKPASYAIDAIRIAIRDVDKTQSIFFAESMEDVLGDTLIKERFTMMMLGIFGALSLIMATLGIYGVVSYNVTQRKHEIGIRTALGAQSKDVIRMILKQGMKPVIFGCVIGSMIAYMLGQFLKSLLYEITVSDPVTLAIVITLLIITSFLACFLPAFKATKVNPLEMLKHE